MKRTMSLVVIAIAALALAGLTVLPQLTTTTKAEKSDRGLREFAIRVRAATTSGPIAKRQQTYRWSIPGNAYVGRRR